MTKQQGLCGWVSRLTLGLLIGLLIDGLVYLAVPSARAAAPASSSGMPLAAVLAMASSTAQAQQDAREANTTLDQIEKEFSQFLVKNGNGAANLALDQEAQTGALQNLRDFVLKHRPEGLAIQYSIFKDPQTGKVYSGAYDRALADLRAQGLDSFIQLQPKVSSNAVDPRQPTPGGERLYNAIGKSRILTLVVLSFATKFLTEKDNTAKYQQPLHVAFALATLVGAIEFYFAFRDRVLTEKWWGRQEGLGYDYLPFKIGSVNWGERTVKPALEALNTQLEKGGLSALKLNRGSEIVMNVNFAYGGILALADAGLMYGFSNHDDDIQKKAGHEALKGLFVSLGGSAQFIIAYGVGQTLLAQMRDAGMINETQRFMWAFFPLLLAKIPRVMVSNPDEFWTSTLINMGLTLAFLGPLLIKYKAIQYRNERIAQLMEDSAIKRTMGYLGQPSNIGACSSWLEKSVLKLDAMLPILPLRR